MSGFEDLIAMLANPGDDGLPDDFTGQLTSSYQDATTTRDAKIGDLEASRGEMEAVIAAKDAEIARQKIINYDLLMASPGENDETPNNNETHENTIDSLFE